MTDRATEQARYARAYEDPGYRMGPYRRAALLHWLRQFAPAAMSYLDVGCGRGESVSMSMDFDVPLAIGLEVVPVAPDVLAGQNWSRVLRMDGVHRLPAFDATFDLVTCLDVLEHVDEQDALAGLRELIRVTRRRLLISVAWHSSVWHGVELHITRWPKEWWMDRLREAVLDVGFGSVESLEEWHPPAECGTGPSGSAWFEVVRA